MTAHHGFIFLQQGHMTHRSDLLALVAAALVAATLLAQGAEGAWGTDATPAARKAAAPLLTGRCSLPVLGTRSKHTALITSGLQLDSMHWLAA